LHAVTLRKPHTSSHKITVLVIDYTWTIRGPIIHTCRRPSFNLYSSITMS